MGELERIEESIRRLRRAGRLSWQAFCILTAIFAGLVLSAMLDLHRYTERGFEKLEFRNFEMLAECNPDVVAWIRLDQTRIDHPVVRGEDNFEYLDKAFDGSDYAGGCIFLDAACDRQFRYPYNILHGHHMSGGAMFGDLVKYTDKDFFEQNSTGVLLTPETRFALTVAGVRTVSAYDGAVYGIADDRPLPLELLEACDLRREVVWEPEDQMLLLSTCAGDLSDNRLVVICRMRYTGPNDRKQNVRRTEG